MSHVTTVDVEITDLGALGAACRRVGLEFRRDQKQHRYWNGAMSDCEHAIGVPGDDAAHEIGLVRAEDRARGSGGGFVFALDQNAGHQGKSLMDRCGRGCGRLKQAYAAEVATAAAQLEGFHVNELPQPDGSIQLQLTKP